MAWNLDDSVVPALFRKLEKLPSDSVVTKRLWSLADDFTDGLGAAGDEQDWSPSAIRQSLVKSAKQSSSPTAESAAEPVAESVAATPAIAAAAPAMAAKAPATAAPNAPRAAAPAKKVVESSASSARVPPPEGIRKVDVFYGTNRQVNRLSMFGSRLRWGAFGVALGCTMFCIVGFAKKRAIAYAVVALVGLLGLTAMARDSLDMAFWFPHRTKIYSGEYSDEIKLGVCQVTIPKNHVPGELESPSFLMRMEVKWDPEKHIVLTNTQPLEREEFYSQLHSCMDRSGKNLLVFVHGYNVSFEDAARRTAQMAADLQFPGAPVFFSWPSHNDWYRYPDDAENIQASVKQIRSFLEQIARESKAESINLVAHSMGSVGLTQALAGLSSREPLFNQVVLAAPDIDATVFREEIAPRITKTAKRVTLYTSQTDLALLASRYFNAGDRVGDSSRGVLSIPGIEVIDATEIDSSLLGHSYYGGNIQVLDDIANLFRNKPLTDRKYLEYHADAMPPHWSFSPLYRSATKPASPGSFR
jgi:esterase/lipase superfamily enzyme